MKSAIKKICHSTAIGGVCILSGLQPIYAASLSLSDVPLFIGKVSIPNVFFSIDDSGSMDWEILTKKHWSHCAYDINAANAPTGDQCGAWITTGLWRSYANGDAEFEYMYENGDQLYTGNGRCSTGSSHFATTVESCDNNGNGASASDWRIRSADFNVVYYSKAVNYQPWQGGQPALANADFKNARSNPASVSTGYNNLKDLTGFVYEEWEDDRGFDVGDGRPLRGSSLNANNTPNAIVDLWDSHTRVTLVNDTDIKIERVSYNPTATSLGESVTLVATLSGLTTSDARLGNNPDGSNRTVADVRQNVANWYQYSRKRSFVTKNALAAVVTEEPGFRYGMNTINSTSFFTEVPAAADTNFVTHNGSMLQSLFDFTWPAVGTPLLSGLARAGQYYDDVLSGKTNPIINECQQNFTVLFTDGYWNGSAPSGIGNADSDPYSVTVADVAKYYYDKDLDTNLANKVKTTDFDQNDKQHMVTFTVAFGVSGKLVDTDGDDWPDPDLTESSDWGNALLTNSPEKIDDLWHAAFNSKGGFIAASTPKDVVSGLQDALAEIKQRGGSSAAAAASSTSVGSDTSIYQAEFDIDWSGKLVSHAVSDGTGSRGCGTTPFGDVCSAEEWNAASMLTSQNYDTGRKIITYNPSANSGAGQGIPFRWPADIANLSNTDLSQSQVDAILNNADAAPSGLSLTNQQYGQGIINYLRGDNSLSGSGTGKYGFRVRPLDISLKPKVLGSIIHSAPVYVTPPLAGYSDTMEAVSYSSFASAYSSRKSVIYVGANDGMLHGFSAVDGKELIAYVPSVLYSKLPRLASKNYAHTYMVDGSPSVGDAFINNKWRTVLVGGLAGGGKSIYALDVTDPSKFEESQASSLVLWEFTDSDDSDLGYAFSQPDIVKLNNDKWAAIFGNGYNSASGLAVFYVVDLATGNLIKKISTNVGSTSSPNGLSTATPVDIDGDLKVDYVYAGDLKGNLWKFDLRGSNPTQWDVAFKTGSTKKPLFSAIASDGSVQPITARPAVDFHPEPARGGLMIYFGTGKYLEPGDVASVAQSTQTFYGIWDQDRDPNSKDTVDNKRSSGKYDKLLEQSIDIQTEGIMVPVDTDGDGKDDSNVTVDLRVTSTHSVNWDTQLGWYMELRHPDNNRGNEGERQVTNPVLRDGRVIFTTLIPGDSCSGGGSSFLMELDAADGGRLPEPPFDLNNDGIFDSRDLHSQDESGNTVKRIPSGIRFGEGILSTPKVLNCRGEECKYLSNSLGGLEKVNENSLGTGRLSWRQLYRQ